MQSKKLFQLVVLIGVVLPNAVLAQEVKNKQVIINEGTASVMDGGVVSMGYDFDNTSQGSMKNDGTIYYYRNFNNDNIYTHSKDLKGSKAVFTRYEDQGKQVISGNSFSEFYHVELNNPEPTLAFDLKSNMDINGTVVFKNGIIKVDSLQGMLSFHQGARALTPTDVSHADGLVEKIGNEEFQYPKGDKGLYRYARISAPVNEKDVYEGKYALKDKNFFREHATKSGVINLLNEREYWIINKGNKNNRGDVMLTLSWDERTTPKELLKNPEKELHIVRWDEKQQLWVDEGGVVDLKSKEITTATSVQGYGFFTLATVKTDWLLEGDIVIYNFVTPNGDGKNDYFTIDNIKQFPNNIVEIYNRWGVKVYDTKNYDSNGNVFRGYSDGRSTLNKNEKLPTGTYFYTVTYDYSDTNGKRINKKSGFLHLDND